MCGVCVVNKSNHNHISRNHVPIEQYDRTNQAVFAWQEPHQKGVTGRYDNQKSTWNSGVTRRKAIRQRLAEEDARKHLDRVTGAWEQISKKQRQGNVSYDPSIVTASEHGT